jgi:hypothetical protein
MVEHTAAATHDFGQYSSDAVADALVLRSNCRPDARQVMQLAMMEDVGSMGGDRGFVKAGRRLGQFRMHFNTVWTVQASLG